MPTLLRGAAVTTLPRCRRALRAVAASICRFSRYYFDAFFLRIFSLRFAASFASAPPYAAPPPLLILMPDVTLYADGFLQYYAIAAATLLLILRLMKMLIFAMREAGVRRCQRYAMLLILLCR